MSGFIDFLYFLLMLALYIIVTIIAFPFILAIALCDKLNLKEAFKDYMEWWK